MISSFGSPIEDVMLFFEFEKLDFLSSIKGKFRKFKVLFFTYFRIGWRNPS